MPTNEPDTPVVVDEEQEQVPLPIPPVIIGGCRRCEAEIIEGSDHATCNSYGIAGTNHLYYCRSCALSLVNEAVYHCGICEDNHLDGSQLAHNFTTRGAWDDEVWVRDVDLRYMRANSTMRWCEDESPRCENCGDEELSVPDSWSGEYLDVQQCTYCRRESYDGLIHDWSYVPPLTFRDVQGGDVITNSRAMRGVPYLGMELEMENAEHLAEEILDSFGSEIIWLKRDGSLDDCGVELVTHPATFDWYAKYFPFDALKELGARGAESYHAGTCGIHIHVSSDAFSDAHLFKFLSFHYDNPVICQTIGQRGSADYCSWSGWMETRPHLVKFAKKDPYSRPSHRYVAVNLTEEATIELRYFKGNLNPDRVRKNLEWVDAVYRYTKQLTAKGVKEGKLSFPHLLEWAEQQGDRYRTLLTFIEDRQVNMLGEATNRNDRVDV